MLCGCKRVFYRYLPFVFPCLIFIKMSVWSFFYMCVGDNKVFKKNNTSVCVSRWLWFRAQFTSGRTAKLAQSTKRSLSVHCHEKEIEKQLVYFVFMVLVQKLFKYLKKVPSFWQGSVFLDTVYVKDTKHAILLVWFLLNICLEFLIKK